jgi:hypothetical protein
VLSAAGSLRFAPTLRKSTNFQVFRIGETGFEPATARPPAGCATRLRHSPWCVQAGDGNRTRPRSLEGFCATTTLRPQAARDRIVPGRGDRLVLVAPRRARYVPPARYDPSAMPLRAVGVTALLTVLCWGAWDWASSTGHATIGMVAGVLLVPFALALIGCLALAVAGLARVRSRVASTQRSRPSNPGAVSRPDAYAELRAARARRAIID